MMPMLAIGPPRCNREETVPCTVPRHPCRSTLISPRPQWSNWRSKIDALRRHKPAAFQGEQSQPLRRTIGTRRFAGQRYLPAAGARPRRRDIEIGIHQIEHGFGVAEFEIDAAVAHMDGGRGAHHRAVHEGEEIPVAGVGLRQINVRAFERRWNRPRTARPAATRCWDESRWCPCRRWAPRRWPGLHGSPHLPRKSPAR